MAINKVMDSVGNVLIDLTGDTVTPDKVLQGYTFHNRSGQAQTGTLATTPQGPASKYSEDNIVRFIDYDGEIIAEYSIAEANALQALPTPPAHERIIFEKWNHTLEDVQTTTHSLCVGALYTTVDDAAYVKFFVTSETISVSHAIRYFKLSTGTFNIDWGDGTNEDVTITSTGTGYSVSPSHYYSSTGVYVIKITKGTANIRIYSYGGSSDSSCYCIFSDYRLTLKVLEINVPSWQSITNNYNNRLGTLAFQGARNLTAVSIPSTFIGYNLNYVYGDCNLNCIIFPTETCVAAGNSQYNVRKNMYFSMPRKLYLTGWEDPSLLMQGVAHARKNIIFPDKYYFDNGTTIVEKTELNWTAGSNTIYMSSELEYVYLGNVFSTKKIGWYTAMNSSTEFTIKRLKKIDGNYGIFADSGYYTPSVTYDMSLSDCENFTINPNYSLNGATLYINLLNISLNQKTVILKPPVSTLYLTIQNKQRPLNYLDMSLFETPPTLSSIGSTLTCITFKILVMPGTLSLYENATNWSTLYAAGLIEEATS